MAVISITIPDPVVARVRTAFTNTYGYQATIPDPSNPGQTIPNPETASAFMRRMLMNFVKDTVKGYEASQAVRTARQTAVDAAENDISLS